MPLKLPPPDIGPLNPTLPELLFGLVLTRLPRTGRPDA